MSFIIYTNIQIKREREKTKHFVWIIDNQIDLLFFFFGASIHFSYFIEYFFEKKRDFEIKFVSVFIKAIIPFSFYSIRATMN